MMIQILVIHLGSHFPHYIKDCIHQIRLLNPKETTDIVLIINKVNYIIGVSLEYDYNIKIFCVEELPRTSHYDEFLEQSKLLLDHSFRQNYCQYILERYFAWEGYLLLTNQMNTYFIESDNLLYVDLNTIQKTETLFYQDIAMPFDSDDRGAPSFIFVRNRMALTRLNQWIVDCMKNNITDDMYIYGLYRKTHPDLIFPYPVLPSSSNNNINERKNKLGQAVSSKDCTFLCDERFPIIFDTVVYGQAISGIDPRNTNAQQSVGYINEKAIFSIEETKLSWKRKKLLWAIFANDIQIVNLHIHSKALSCFLSDRPGNPVADYNVKELLQKINQDYAE